MRCVRDQISDAAIRRYAKKPVRQISDTRYPVKFRFNANRDKGSWYVVTSRKGKTIWRKVGGYPAITPKRLIERLPDIMTEIMINPDSPHIAVGRFETVADLVSWYVHRCSNARYLGEARRKAIESIARCHLLPKLGVIKLAEMRHEHVDDRLIVPMQADYSLAYIRQVFDVLRISFKKAQELRQIEHNPIAAFKFSDFISSPIKPRDSRLRTNQMLKLFEQLESADDTPRMLCLLMLLHGTRIGETRMARWDHMDWGDRVWLLPSENTKTKETHRIPLTDTVVAMLKRYRALQEYYDYRGVYLFPNHRGTFTSDSKASDLVRGVSGGNWTAHDLRKMARTVWADLGVDYMVSERLLNHKLTKLDQAYIHTYVETQKRAALERYHTWLKKNGMKEFMANV